MNDVNKFQKWLMKIQNDFLENKLFQPTGLQISCSNIIFETKDDYSLKNLENSVDEEDYPIAYYRPDDKSIHVFIEHEMFERRKTDFEKQAYLMFLLYHEANHKLLLHDRRAKGKIHDLWNIACDMEIHNMLYVINQIMKAISSYDYSLAKRYMNNHIEEFLFTRKEYKEGLFDIKWLSYTAEEMYVMLQNTKIESEIEIPVQIDGMKGTAKLIKTTFTLPSEEKITTSTLEFPEFDEKSGGGNNEENNEENQDMRNSLLKNSISSVIKNNHDICDPLQRGTISNECIEFIKKIFHVKIDWEKILRSSLKTAIEKDEAYSWASPRISLFGMNTDVYLPGHIDDKNQYGTLIIARDESGSISNQQMEKAISIILESKNYFKKIVLLKHDTVITEIKYFDDIDENSLKNIKTRNSNGGTSHKEVFEFINKYSRDNEENERISCCIMITDMESDIEEWQNTIPDCIPRIYLAAVTKDYFANMKNVVKNIKGKIIHVE